MKIRNETVSALSVHVDEICSILKLSDVRFKKFYRLYTGEKLVDSDINEGKLLLVKMLAQCIVDDIEEVLKDGDWIAWKNEPPFYDVSV